MTLISVVMAFTLLALVIGPAAYLVAQTTLISGQTRSRVVAANLAQSALSTIQAQSEYDFAQIVDSEIGTTTNTTTVGGITYTVTTETYWSPGDDSAGACGSSGTSPTGVNPLLSATATVTWANIGANPPVSVTSAYHPPSSVFSPNDGTIIIDVVNGSGQPQPDVTAAVTDGPTAISNANGCIVFPNITPGTATVALSPPSGYTYVDPTGDTSPSTVLGITASDTTEYTFEYAQAASIAYSAPTGEAIPWGLGITLGSPGLPNTESDYFTETGPGTLADVFPTPDNYALVIGSCVPFSSYSSEEGPTIATTPGSATSTVIAGTPLTVTVDSSSGTPVSGAEISITNTDSSGTADADCGPSGGISPTATDVTTTNSAGSATILAPLGSFTVSASSGGNTGTSTVQTPTPGSATDVTITLS